MVGNTDINRRVVIRAYAPCLAWKTIFHAGDNSCRPVFLSLSLTRVSSSLSDVTGFSAYLCPPLSLRFRRLVPSCVGGRGPRGPSKPPARYLIVSPRPCQERTGTELYQPRVLLVPSWRVALVHVYRGRLNWNWPARAL